MIFFESASTLPTSIFARSRLELLPTKIIARVGNLLQHLDSKPIFSQRLALACGIFINPKEENQAVVLHWSPLINYADCPIDRMPLENLSDLAKTFIKEHFTTAVARLHDCALAFFPVEFPRTCVFYLAKGISLLPNYGWPGQLTYHLGYCGKLKTGDCTRSHEMPSEKRAMAKIHVGEPSENPKTITNLFFEVPSKYHRAFRKAYGIVLQPSLTASFQ